MSSLTPSLAVKAGPVAAAPATLTYPSPIIIGALFVGYLAVGLPLPVIPLFVHEGLGFSNLVVGLTIGIQFLATVLTRGYAGGIVDRSGGKRAALWGAVVGALGSLLYLLATLPGVSAELSLAVILAARLVDGLGESLFVTGCISWSIASVGREKAGMSMSWTGIAMFGALAVGAPVGMLIYGSLDFRAVMIACVVTPLIAAALALAAPSWTTPAGRRLPFIKVVGQVWQEGIGLMLSGVGLAALTAFASLYFAARGWANAGLVMTAFGVGFIFMRLVFGGLPDRLGGYCVALASLVIEALGQMMLWGAPVAEVALAGALVTGLGCALVFPSLGVETLKRVPEANRGSAMGAFVAFLDIAYGVSGPATGFIAGQFGYAAVYLFGALSCSLGAALVLNRIRRAV